MAEKILLPKMHDSMTHAKIKWLKKVGDPIQAGDILAEVETDKAAMELESYESGVLLFQEAAPVIRLNQMLCIIGEQDENIEELL